MEWKRNSTMSLLWIHGKRTPPLFFRILLDVDHFELL